jgi:hypothetical protein
MNYPRHPPDLPPGNKYHRVNLAVAPRLPTAGSAKVSIRHRVITAMDQLKLLGTRGRAGMLSLSSISFVLKRFPRPANSQR